jgi:hypothetical protein
MRTARWSRDAKRGQSHRRCRRPWRRWFAALGALGVTCLLVSAPASSVRAASVDPSVEGAWTAPFDLGVRAIHTSVLHNGKLLLFSYPVTAVGSDAFVWDPSTGTSTNVSLSWPRDIFCAGHTFLADGRLLVTGGHVHNGAYGLGIRNTDIFDPVSNTFSPGPLLSQPRWYPTSLTIANGHVLTIGGTEDKTTPAKQIDDYDPVTNVMTTLPASATKQVNNYPRVHLLWNGKVSFTNQAKSWLFDPSTNQWAGSAIGHFGGRGETDNSILLSGGKRVLEFGGADAAAGAASATAEIIDFSSAAPQWRTVSSMHFPRVWANSVMLPDGTVLTVGGSTGGQYTNPVYTPELFDPTTETWTTLAPQTAARIYHSTAVLLPDGRVFSAGMDKGSYQTTGEIFSPPYLFKGPRPTIASVPSNVTYGSSFSISTPDASSVTRAVLMQPGSVTHSVNSDQRHVDLTVSAVDVNTLSATAPADGKQAPAGWYMLFLLNGNGVPSVASWVHVGGADQVPAPTISSFTPTAADRGAAIDITGTGFTGASSVTFGGAVATTYTVVSDTKVTAVVPAAARSGPIAITTAGGTATSPATFTVTQPEISGLNPSSGVAGDTIEIVGTDLSSATSVSFVGATADFTVVSDTSIRATVPTAAASGPVKVTTPGGTATSPAPFTVTSPLGYRATVLSDRPAGYWRLSEQSGAAVDETGNQAGGTYTGGVTRGVPGALATDANTAAAFDGTSGLVSVPDSAALHTGDSFTYEAWFKRTTVQGTAQRLISKGVGPTLGFGTNNKLVLIAGGTGAVAVTTSTVAVTDQSWHQVVVTKSGSAVRLYIDGVDRTGAVTNTTFASNSAPLVIGRAQTASGYFSGSIDEVAVYGTALTAQQVQDHRKAATG